MSRSVHGALPLMGPPFLEGLPMVGQAYQPTQAATQQLQRIIEGGDLVAPFTAAIERVAMQNVRTLSQIRTLNQFYFYVDALVEWIPEIRVMDFDGTGLKHERTVYLRITEFYFYFNTEELEALQSPIAPVTGEDLTPVSRWLRDFAVAWGAFLDTPASAKWLPTFQYAPEYHWQDFEKAPADYATFNAFFGREFRDIAVQRPVASPKDDQVVVFPAESTFVTQCAVGTSVGPPLAADASIVVKNIEWSVRELLADSEFAEAFEGGLLCHSFLNTYDYHRLHTVAAGEVLEARFVPGQVYLEVDLVSGEGLDGDLGNAVIPRRLLDASDSTGYQFVQCRGLIVLETAIGKVAILPMGMAQVSSVVFVTPKAEGHRPIELSPEEKQGMSYEQQVAMLNERIERQLVGKTFEKGEMFSFFQFGGSDCVVVFEARANMNIHATVGVHYPVRSQYGFANI